MRLIFSGILLAATLSISVSAQTIVFRGSDTLGDDMVPKLAKAYQASGGAAQFDIVAEGSSAAFKALASGEAEIGMSSRPIKDSEKEMLAAKGLEVKEHVAGVDMIAVIVNAQNDANNIPLDGVKMIFTGQVETWKRLSGEPAVQPFTRNESSGTFKVFQKVAMGGADYGANCIKTDGNGEIAEKVAANLGGVGYVGLSYANAPGVKSVPVEGVTPDPANSATYPLSRKLYYYTIEGKLSDAGKSFITWAKQDPAAAKIISEVGFIAP